MNYAIRTLNRFATQSAGLFPQGMYHHTLLCCRALICFASLLFYPILMGKFRGFHVCVVSISPASNVFWRVFNAVHLLSIANKVTKLVSVRKELYTRAQEPVHDRIIWDILLCVLCKKCILCNLCILCVIYIYYVYNANYAVLTASLEFPGFLNLPRPLQEIVDDTDDTMTKA